MNKKATHKKRPAVFLDRDGTIIRFCDVPKNKKDIVVFKSAGPALRRLKDLGYLLVVITNQPIIEKGIVTMREVERLNRYMESQLKPFGVRFDGVYVCPHRYGSECRCRKPDQELIERATKDLHIDLAASWFVGDTTRDMETGKRAGIPTVLVKTGDGGKDTSYFSTKGDYEARDLRGVANIIASKSKSVIG